MTKATTNVKEPKTIKISIKVRTLVTIVVVILGLIGSFVAGVYATRGYHDKVTNDAVGLVKQLK